MSLDRAAFDALLMEPPPADTQQDDERHRLPHVEAWTMDPDRSVAVELCPFRLCPWTSPDTRVADRPTLDALLARHLADEHRPDLDRLAALTPAPLPLTVGEEVLVRDAPYLVLGLRWSARPGMCEATLVAAGSSADPRAGGTPGYRVDRHGRRLDP